MSTPPADTIVAVATPRGRGGISILRLSGQHAARIARQCSGALPPAHKAGLRTFTDGDGNLIDQGLVLFFPAPQSYTGEDVVELHAHGSPLVLQMLTKRCCALGARLARAGEFSERAFLNGQLDLAQAEAVADLIESATEAAARSAMRSLKGEFSAHINRLVARVTQLRVYVEAAIDFPDEEIDFLAGDQVRAQLAAIQQELTTLRAAAKRGRVLRDGLSVVLVGLPNAGKSSLLNALSQQPRAIVSAIPGTTRDLLEYQLDLDGLPVLLTDTAGLRHSHDEIEAEGVRRAQGAAATADLILLVVDDTATAAPTVAQALLGDLEPAPPICRVRNKIDLSGRAAGCESSGAVAVSATRGDGLDSLVQQIKHIAGFYPADEPGFIARQRHLDALESAAQHLQHGVEQLHRFQAGELLAEELSACQTALGEITGRVSSDELLGLIFGQFCIGK